MNLPDNGNPWFAEFEQDSDKAVSDLLLEQANLGNLQAAEPADILVDWLVNYSEYTDFVQAVDESITKFIENQYGSNELVEISEAYAASVWSRVSIIIRVGPLPLALQKLRQKVEENPEYLQDLNAEYPHLNPYNWAMKALEKQNISG